MAVSSQPERDRFNSAGRCLDFLVTIGCWCYFTLGYLLCFAPAHIAASLSGSRREERFQRLNCLFYRGFFRLLKVLAPRQSWAVDREAVAIRSSVVVSNHLSYLDPLLFISLYPRQKTVVKTGFFEVPIFGWVLRNAGYFPADGSGKYARMMLAQVETMQPFLQGGGNLFIFPEGTRSRDGSVGKLNRGALKIARICQAPICIVRLANTDRLFEPGTFLFNTRRANKISLELVERLTPEEVRRQPLAELERRLRLALARNTANGAQRGTRENQMQGSIPAP